MAVEGEGTQFIGIVRVNGEFRVVQGWDRPEVQDRNADNLAQAILEFPNGGFESILIEGSVLQREVVGEIIQDFPEEETEV